MPRANPGRSVIVLSEYGITPVDRPVHINRALRDAGLLVVREEDGGELLDPIASRAFALSDHQIAHIYVADPGLLPKVRSLVEGLPGVERIYGGIERRAVGLDHVRSGELIAMADAAPGSPIIIGMMIGERPTSRAPSRFIASPATTRSNCFSILRSRRRRPQSANACFCASSDFGR